MPTNKIISAAEEEKPDTSPNTENPTPKSKDHSGSPQLANGGVTRCITPFPKRCHRSKNL